MDIVLATGYEAVDELPAVPTPVFRSYADILFWEVNTFPGVEYFMPVDPDNAALAGPANPLGGGLTGQ